MAAKTGTAVRFNLGDFLKALSVLAGLLPAITAFIKAMETEGLPGADKKAAVLQFIRSLLGGAGVYVSEISADVIEVVMTFADSLVDSIVAAYNHVKLFFHKAPTP
jgi:hypothetical protein